MQEAAYANAESGGLGTRLLDANGLCWILMRVAVRMDVLPRWGEEITVETWNRGCCRLTWLRDYEFYDQAGRLIGRASSEWLIASSSDHKPQRPEQILVDKHLPDDSRAVFADKIFRPAQLPPEATQKPVLSTYADYSDIDRNGHVNNTRYAAWCINALHAVCRTADGNPARLAGRGSPG